MAIKDPDFDTKIDHLAARAAAFRVNRTPLGLSLEVPSADCELFLRFPKKSHVDARGNIKHMRIVHALTTGEAMGFRTSRFLRDAEGGRGWNPIELVRELEHTAHAGYGYRDISDLRLAAYVLTAIAASGHDDLAGKTGFNKTSYSRYVKGFAANKEYGLGLDEEEAFILFQRVRNNIQPGVPRSTLVFGRGGRLQFPVPKVKG